MIKVTVWNEFVHEKESEKVRAIYPEGIHKAIADFLGAEDDILTGSRERSTESCGWAATQRAETLRSMLP